MVRLMKGLDDAPYDLILAYYYPKQILKPTPTPEFDFASVFSRGSTPLDASFDDDDMEDYLTSRGSGTKPTKKMAAVAEKLVALRRDFDPITWMKRVPAMLPILRKNATPGSYKHFLLMLLESDSEYQKIQHQMQEWLADKVPDRQVALAPGAATSMRMMDKSQLTDELDILRKLLKPLRRMKIGSDWIDVAYEIKDDSVQGLLKASAIIQEFEGDILACIEGKEADSNPAPNGSKRMSFLSMRITRIDACRDMLYRKHSTPREPANFAQYYERYQRGQHDLPTAIHDADFGLPVRVLPKTISYESLPALPHDTKWENTPMSILEMMVDIARWLSRIRCTEAVDLFCDVGLLFTPTEPTAMISDARYSVLRTLCDAVFASDFDEPTKAPRPYWQSGRGLSSTNSQWESDSRESHKELLGVLRSRMTDENPAAPEGRHGHRLTSLAKVRKQPEALQALSVLEEDNSCEDGKAQQAADDQLECEDEGTEPLQKGQQKFSDEKEELRKQLEKTKFFLGGDFDDSSSSSSDDGYHAGVDEKNSQPSFETLTRRGSVPAHSYLGTSF